jgi:hypothetical protein
MHENLWKLMFHILPNLLSKDQYELWLVVHTFQVLIYLAKTQISLAHKNIIVLQGIQQV